MHKVLTQHLPDPCPHEPDSRHIQVSDFNQLLKTELSRVHIIVQLSMGNLAKVLDELDDGILVQIQAALEDLLNLGHFDVLYDHLAV